MASWQSHVVVFIMKLRFKKKITGAIDIQTVRKSLAAIKHGVPKGLRAETATVGGVAGEWMRANGRTDAPTLLYLHGGAYIACSPQTHRPITGGFAKRGFAVFAPDYRLAPEHPFPAAIDDAVAAYRGLVASGIPASSIMVAGDSAGGGLVLAMLLSLRDAGDEMPAAMALFSPWTDLAATGESVVSNDRKDAMFYGDGIGRSAKIYLAGTDPSDPLASPLYARLQGLPPMLIHAGSYEVLRDDSTRLAERAQAAGVPVQIRLWPVLPHVWQVIPWIPEAAESLDAAAAFLLANRPVRDMAA